MRTLWGQSQTFHSTPSQCLPSSLALDPASGYAALSTRRLISLSGPDAAKFLQGAITRNIYDVPADSTELEGPPRKSGIYGAFLTAQGRMLNDVFIYPDAVAIASKGPEGDAFLVEVDAGEAERLARHIKLYKLRANFTVRLLGQDEATVWHTWGQAAPPSSNPGCISMMDPRAPGMGVRFVAPLKNAPQGIADELPLAHESVYTIRRYLHGIPEGQTELLREVSLPLESNLDLMGGIDFRKGCYVGQELTIRTKHRGVVRKRILPVVLYGPGGRDDPARLEYHDDPGLVGASPSSDLRAERIPPETQIGRVGKKGRSAGKFLRGIGNVGLALCRLEVMTDVHVPGAESAVVLGGGFNPEDEFVVEIGKDTTTLSTVKVKAFVPDWLKKALTASSHHG